MAEAPGRRTPGRTPARLVAAFGRSPHRLLTRFEDASDPTPAGGSGDRRARGARDLLSRAVWSADRLVVVPGDRVPDRLQPHAHHPDPPVPSGGRADGHPAVSESATRPAGPHPQSHPAATRAIGPSAQPDGRAAAGERAAGAGPGVPGRSWFP